MDLQEDYLEELAMNFNPGGEGEGDGDNEGNGGGK